MESSRNPVLRACEAEQGRELAKRVLSNPTQLRVLLLSTIFGIWYVVLYAPDDGPDRRPRERGPEGAASAWEWPWKLSGYAWKSAVSRTGFPRTLTQNEWVQYMMNGLRGSTSDW